jgi:hypothetical protein
MDLTVRGMNMKRIASLSAIGILLTGGLLFAQEGAKDEAKDAGHDVKKAAKDTGKAAKHTGKAVAKGTKKGVNKAAGATEKGADKVKEKTE